MELVNLIQQNLLSPHLLFFALGIIAGLLKSDLAIPEQLGKFFAIYLMVTIGFQGGVAIANAGQVDGRMAATLAGGWLVGLLQPFMGYFLLQKTTQLDKPTAAAVAAHYGSISMVTFVAAQNFLGGRAVPYAGYIVAVIALMEAPAVLSGLFIAYKADPSLRTHSPQASSQLVRHIATNGAILLLIGAFFIGWITGSQGLQKVAGLVTPLQAILLFFLLDMGLLVAQHVADLKGFSISLLLFGIYMPLINSLIGIGVSMLIGLDKGTGFLFTVLVASASYIVVTAAMRTALPQAKVAIYLPMSLAVTFPFNITLGIPLYFSLAERFLL
ncbi:MAG: sodium-dependent bicarbonate transport family permease [Bacteroidota bacterium]